MSTHTTVPCLLALAIPACAPTIATDLGDTGGETSSGTMQPSTSDESTSTSSGIATETSGSSGGEPMPCTPSWPDDGSEIVEVVGHSSVAEWWHNADYDDYYESFLSDTSPIAGTQTRGLVPLPGVSVTAPYNWTATVGGIPADPFLGKRIRMRSLVALEDVEGSASLWMRLDDVAGESSLALDNPHNHPDWGTSSDWELHEIVMDVPMETTWIAYGSLLVGPGILLASDATLEVVTDDVPTTTPNRRPPSGAITCAAPTDAFVEDVLHYTRPDVWYDFGNEAPVSGLVLDRDEDVLYDGVPTLHVELDGSATLGDGPVWYWPPGDERRRVRMTLPIRGDFDGAVQLYLQTYMGQTVVLSRVTEPVELDSDAEWTSFTVVGEIPETARVDLGVGIVAEGKGELWVGYGVIEHVSDDVPLTPVAG